MKEKFLTEDEYKTQKELIQANKNKTVHKRLKVIELWHEGCYTQEEIAKRNGLRSSSRTSCNLAI